MFNFIEVPDELFPFGIDVSFYLVCFLIHVTFSCNLRMVSSGFRVARFIFALTSQQETRRYDSYARTDNDGG